MSARPIPDRYRTVTPYLIVADAAGALDFYRKAFGATESMRMAGPGGRVMHAEITIGDSTLMLADEFPEMGVRGPRSYGGTPVSLLLYNEDVDALFDRAVAAGARPVIPPENTPFHTRRARVLDPGGQEWSFGTYEPGVSW